MEGQSSFRFSGMNIHWLGLDDPNNGTYPTLAQIDEAFDDAQQMGAKVVRSHTLGISTGNPKSIEPSLGQWNEEAFKTIDYAIKKAHDKHIHLIIPLTDNYYYYHGGKHNFTDWEGDFKEDDFYSNQKVIKDFEQYIRHLLTHLNPLTGLAYKDDPIILAWETGNELENESGAWNDGWTERMARYIKSVDHHHLVMDGHRSWSALNRNLTAGQLRLKDVDIYTGHFFLPDIVFMQKDASLAGLYKKAYLIGEYDWTDQDAAKGKGAVTQDKMETIGGNPSANISIIQSSPTDFYDMQLVQGMTSLSAGQACSIRFWAKSSVDHNFIYVQIRQSISPHEVYFKQKVLLSSSWLQYAYDYVPPRNLDKADFLFNLSHSTGHVWLTGVSFGSKGRNFLENGFFDKPGKQWFMPWEFQVKPAGDYLAAFLPAVENAVNVSGDLFWQLYGRTADGTDRERGDNYTLYYPGTTSFMKSKVNLLTHHAANMRTLRT
jgi:hypothetical protein